jgi:predicted nucleotidyltransferase
VDADVPRESILTIEDQLEDSIVPFGVDIVTTRQLQGEFGQRVRQEAIQWM